MGMKGLTLPEPGGVSSVESTVDSDGPSGVDDVVAAVSADTVDELRSNADESELPGRNLAHGLGGLLRALGRLELRGGQGTVAVAVGGGGAGREARSRDIDPVPTMVAGRGAAAGCDRAESATIVAGRGTCWGGVEPATTRVAGRGAGSFGAEPATTIVAGRGAGSYGAEPATTIVAGRGASMEGIGGMGGTGPGPAPSMSGGIVMGRNGLGTGNGRRAPSAGSAGCMALSGG
jgi:hypothetical protein